MKFPSAGDPDCRHRSHYECVACKKIVCERCGVEMAEPSREWKTIGYWCDDCLREKEA